MVQHNILVENVRSHNELPDVEKTCPGRLLNMDYVRAILSKQENLSASRYATTLNPLTETKGEIRTLLKSAGFNS
jgi:hypothetical protein